MCSNRVSGLHSPTWLRKAPAPAVQPVFPSALSSARLQLGTIKELFAVRLKLVLTMSGKGAKGGQGASGGKSNPMTPADSARIQSAGAKAGGAGVGKDSFAARAQSAGAKNANAGITGKGGK